MGLRGFSKLKKRLLSSPSRCIVKNIFLALYLFLFSWMIFLLFCLLPSAVLFTLTIWPFGPPLSVPAAVETTQEALIQVERWFEYWCYFLNSSKCVAPFFSKSPPSSPLLFQLPFASIPLQLFLESPSTALFPFLNVCFCWWASSILISRPYAMSLLSHWAPLRSPFICCTKLFWPLPSNASPG